ncbi:hypothetical protein RHSIM_Rhsim07G0201300 [Rhododendron simsii]|uniref:EF-hand domain-containing protein n=1 Tax=Rhododendron simsii TaxID=118357 RepID=A0A834GPZ4_RHOSS|nr:hypothetical protein RHSIM_Rhsim07G0201300 [Rhododendron simsii]
MGSIDCRFSRSRRADYAGSRFILTVTLLACWQQRRGGGGGGVGGYLRLGVHGGAEEEVGHVMAEIDKDGDGFIDLREFTEFHRNGASSSPDATNKELRNAFDLYDKNGNGLLSELHAVMKSLGEKCSLADCSRMIASVNVDSDGCVNFEEFKKMMKRVGNNVVVAAAVV